MHVLQCQPNQSSIITTESGETIIFGVLRANKCRVHIGVAAPCYIKIVRDECVNSKKPPRWLACYRPKADICP